MTDDIGFFCLRCDRMTAPLTVQDFFFSRDQVRQQAEAEGWWWGKALLCPNCRQKTAKSATKDAPPT